MMLKNQKPKLLHITSSLKIGGAERVLVDLIEALRNDYEHEVIFFNDGPHRAILEGWGICCRQVQGAVRLYDPLFWFRLIRSIKKARPDCIHSLLWGANWASRLLGPFFSVPVVNGLHNYLDGYGRLRRTLDAWLLNRADCFVAVSGGVAASYNRVYKGIAAYKVCIIEDGIKVPNNNNQSNVLRVSLQIPENAYVIGTVGRFEPEKNQMLLVQAFSLLAKENSTAFLVLVGYGSLETLLREQVVLFGLEKRVLFVVGKQADDYYGLFDCFVLSSPSEGLSLALLEAMVRSIPCIVANNESSHPALVHEQNGLLVASYDAFSLSKALSRLMHDKSAACSMGFAAKKTVLARYTVDRMARSYRDLFNRCMQK